MANYGRDFYRNAPGRWGAAEDRGAFNRGEPAYGYRSGGYGESAGYGGMRSDGYGSRWDQFPGEEGWYGGAYDRGYRGVGPVYDESYRRGGYGGYAAQPAQEGYGWAGSGDVWGGSTNNRSWNNRQSGIRAADIMTEDPQTVSPDDTIMDVAKKMKSLNVGIIPVVEDQKNKRLKGVITDRDIAVRAVAEGKDGKAKVSDCMTSDVETCNKNDSVESVLELMKRERVRRVPITDREGRLVGIIAQADLAVDFGESRPDREWMVEDTIERISEPASPKRGTRGAAARA
ncbi:MAG TPA: CBS domain-containing protein [Longimicrobiaceae bacterium]|nr:CBS domain-containing protein [Longimicrobiaceae bacterium]